MERNYFLSLEELDEIINKLRSDFEQDDLSRRKRKHIENEMNNFIVYKTSYFHKIKRNQRDETGDGDEIVEIEGFTEEERQIEIRECENENISSALVEENPISQNDLLVDEIALPEEINLLEENLPKDVFPKNLSQWEMYLKNNNYQSPVKEPKILVNFYQDELIHESFYSWVRGNLPEINFFCPDVSKWMEKEIQLSKMKKILSQIEKFKETAKNEYTEEEIKIQISIELSKLIEKERSGKSNFFFFFFLVFFKFFF
jgi:hypothetical protein